HTLDVAGCVLIHLNDVRQHMPHTELLGAVPREERSELTRVQVIGVIGKRAIFRAGNEFRGQPGIAEPALRGHEIAEGLVRSLAPPVRHEIELSESVRKHQRMVVSVVRCARGPACEPTSLLECRVAVTEQGSLRDTHPLQGGADRRPRTFPDADDLDVRRLDQRYREAARLHPSLMAGGYDSSGEPSGGSSADDDY